MTEEGHGKDGRLGGWGTVREMARAREEQVWPVTVPLAGLLPQALVLPASPRFQDGASLDKDSPF